MRIMILVISLAIVAFLFYKYINQSIPSNIGLNINEGDTMLDAPNYARDAVSSAELQNCLSACAIDQDVIEACQSDCYSKYSR